MAPLSFDLSDTIAAVASPAGSGARGIVRLSGPAAWSAATAAFTPDEPGPLVVPRRPSRIAGAFRLPGLRPRLPAAIQYWPGPRTYTGQPLAEIHTIGSPPLIEHLLASVLGPEVRLAGPGEFTLRAFLTGRIDLTRAEAVLGVIEARSAAQLEAALRQLAGGLFGPIAALRDRLLDVLAHLEANLDFVDEADVSELGRSALAHELASAASDVAALAERLRGRERPEGHPRVVLVGPPNAGKSRLFNALLGEARALVSPLPGTTRDYLAAPCACDGLIVELIDTAGAETPRNSIEARAQALRDEQAASADLLVACLPLDESTRTALPTLPGLLTSPTLHVATKADLAAGLHPHGDAIATSAATGAGLDALRSAIARAIQSRGDEADLPSTTGARCHESLRRAADALASASHTLHSGGGDELVSVDLHQAIDDLGRVVGAVVTDDVLDRIFRRFCIGK